MNKEPALPACEAPEPLPVLYSFRRCPYAMRARLAILASGVPCELREVELQCKPAQLLDASAKATVPVLVLPGGEVIEQSLEIMHWSLTQHDPHNWLTPQTETVEAVLALISENDEAFKSHLDRYKYPNRYRLAHAGTDQAFAQIHRVRASTWLFMLEWRLSRFLSLFGASSCLADIAIAPFIRQFARTDMAWFDSQPWPHLKAWLVRWELAFRSEPLMKKYPPWRSGQARVLLQGNENPKRVGNQTVF